MSLITGAKFDDELFRLIFEPHPREQLKAVLISTYFAAKVQPAVAEQESVNLAAFSSTVMIFQLMGWRSAGFATDPLTKGS